MSATRFEIGMFRDCSSSTGRLRQSWPIPFSVIQASEGIIAGEFDGGMRLKQVLLPFLCTHYLAEEY